MGYGSQRIFIVPTGSFQSEQPRRGGFLEKLLFGGVFISQFPVGKKRDRSRAKTPRLTVCRPHNRVLPFCSLRDIPHFGPSIFVVNYQHENIRNDLERFGRCHSRLSGLDQFHGGRASGRRLSSAVHSRLAVHRTLQCGLLLSFLATRKKLRVQSRVFSKSEKSPLICANTLRARCLRESF